MPEQLGNLSQMQCDAHPSPGELHRADKGTAPLPKPDDCLPARVLADVSHDLRAPIQVIRAAVSCLQDPAISISAHSARHAVDIIARAARRMEHLVGDLLDTASERSGALVLHYGATCLPSIIAEAVEHLQTQAEGKRVRIAVEMHLSSEPVRCDEGKVLRVVTNLLVNAVKFAPGGDVVVRGCDRGGEIAIEVEDDGVGISPAELPHVFEPFRTAPRQGAGLGLGLHIARAIVTAHGGRIWIESERGSGTRVTFTLPKETPVRG